GGDQQRRDDEHGHLQGPHGRAVAVALLLPRPPEQKRDHQHPV
ncbi:MAG: hypothetical protein AVDCRST_MAG05-1965, partial [uncultured Rubrobacteraceae bacterium]